MEMIRHGDVLLVRKDIPASAKEIYNGKEFMAQAGETTGHRHMIRGTNFKVLMDGVDRYFDLLNAATITHEEHKELVIPAGTYIQVQEIEKDWFGLTTRQVID